MITNTVESLIPYIRGFIKDLEKKDGKDIFEYFSDDSFTLSQSFISSSSVLAYKNNTAIAATDFSFDSDTNKVLFEFQASGDAFSINDIVTITYNYYKKYSDLEIKGYLNSALAYFVQYRYKKVFEIDDDDNIVSMDNIEPCFEELYFICIITSILIDPQNIEINIDGNFRLTANREKSDQDQIKEAFAQFKRFVGSSSFERIDDINSDVN